MTAQKDKKMTMTMGNPAWVEETWEKISNKLLWVREKSKDKIPYLTVDGVHDDRSDKSRSWNKDDGLAWWTNGFWGGLLWMMYDATGDKRYAEIARISEEKMDACFADYEGLHHDVGFMWRPTAAADYDLTGDAMSRKRAMHAANLLAGRYNPAGCFIRAWNDIPGADSDTRGWAIIDCMLNLSLLYWASEVSSDPRFRHIAVSHARTVQKHFIREDGSVKHLCAFDPESGRYLHSYGGQGYAHGSAWTRGQGWGVYGFMISYRHTGEAGFLETAERIADYILSKVPASGIIPVDFDQPSEPAWEDSCGACVIACGLLELAACGEVAEEKREAYRQTALRILEAIAKTRTDWSRDCDSFVLNCSAAYHNPQHHFTMVYADFYFVEAMRKLMGEGYFMW